MGKDDFLKTLKDSLDNGEFNSDAAKKINDITKKADEMVKSKSVEEINKSIKEKTSTVGVKNIDKDQLEDLNSQYEEKMSERAKEEVILATFATLENLERVADETISNINKLIGDIKQDYNESEEKSKLLFEKINDLQNKYMLNK